jgi:cytochrome c oxidase subunit II
VLGGPITAAKAKPKPITKVESVTRLLTFVLLCVAAVGPAWAAGDATAGKTLFAVCAACHGAQGEGNPAMNSPKLAGQEAWYLTRQLQSFRQATRGAAAGDVYGAQMRPMAMQLKDDAALADVVAYITTLPSKPVPVTVKGDAAAGKTAFTTCAACHGQKAEGMQQQNGPRLAGQEDWYLVRQLANFKKGLRGNDPKDTFGQQMRAMAGVVSSDKLVDDVVTYIGTLH